MVLVCCASATDGLKPAGIETAIAKSAIFESHLSSPRLIFMQCGE
jgi:hypothetical protein